MTSQDSHNQYRHKTTGTIYTSADFGHGGMVEVTTLAGSKYIVHAKNIQRIKMTDSHNPTLDDKLNYIVQDIQDYATDPGRYSEPLLKGELTFVEQIKALIAKEVVDELEALHALPNMYPEKINGEYTHVQAIYKSAIKERIKQLESEKEAL